jgi:hypothetical protein
MNRDAQVSQARPRSPIHLPRRSQLIIFFFQVVAASYISCPRPRPFMSSSGHPSPMLVILCVYTTSPSPHPPKLTVQAPFGSFTPSKGWPSPRRRRPTQPYSCPPCLLRQRCPCRSGSGSLRRSLLAGPSAPNSRPPRTACARPASSFRDTVAGAVVVPLVRWPGSVGWSCVGSQSHGSSGCREGTAKHRRRASGWVHRPTMEQVSSMPREQKERG